MDTFLDVAVTRPTGPTFRLCTLLSTTHEFQPKMQYKALRFSSILVLHGIIPSFLKSTGEGDIWLSPSSWWDTVLRHALTVRDAFSSTIFEHYSVLLV